MISENQVKKYCREDISLIENYEKAIKDNTQTWDCHHRKESQYSADELVDIGEYYGVLASDLIFITHSDHSKLHNKLQDYHNGNSNPMFGKHHSEEAKKKMSECHIGKHYPKLSEAKKGLHLHWYNNGVRSILAKTCPEGFVPGRIVCNKRS